MLTSVTSFSTETRREIGFVAPSGSVPIPYCISRRNFFGGKQLRVL